MQRNSNFQMRARLNPHWPEEDKKYEKDRFDALQIEDFRYIMGIYTKFRDDIEEELKLNAVSEEDRDAIKGLEQYVQNQLSESLEDLLS